MIFAVSSYKSVGCTFLDWSLHYLSGQSQFYHVEHGLIPLASQLVNSVNAHGHIKNHPRGLKATELCLTKLVDAHTDNCVISLYPAPLESAEIAPQLGIDFTPNITTQQWRSINEHCCKNYRDALNHVLDQGIKLIYVDACQDTALYLAQTRSRESSIVKLPNGKTLLDSGTIKSDYQNFFFQNSIETWQSQNLIDIWDQRERQALCARPFEANLCAVGFNVPHLCIDSKSLWYNGEQTVKKCLNYLNLPAVPDRWPHWHNTYQQWQQIQIKILEFGFQYQRIVDSIVNDWWMEIDLTFDQEVIIQHCLIYQYGLNLKTWQLDKFPNNTRELHRLLEPNIHSVPDIYQRSTK